MVMLRTFVTTSEGDSEGGASDHAEERIGHSEWCTCAAMPSAVECICCQEIDELNWKLHGLACITEHGNFSSVCLNEDVLRTAVVSMVDVREDTITEPLTNRPAKLFCSETTRCSGGSREGAHRRALPRLEL